MNVGRQRTLDELRSMARAELKINPTITVYTFTGGVEHRRAANPWAGLNASISGFNASIRDAAEAFAEFNEAFRQAFRDIGQPYTLDGISVLRDAPRTLRLLPGGLGDPP